MHEVDGTTLVLIRVTEQPIKPIACKNRYFKRIQNSNHLMTLDEIANEHLRTINSSWDYHIDTRHDFSDVSMEKVVQLIQRIQRACEQHGLLEPLFEESQQGFRVILHKHGVSGGVSTPEDLALLVLKQPGLNVVDLVQLCGKPQRTVERWFKAEGIQKAKQSFALLSMSDEELRAYNRYQDSLRDEASYVETNYLCAKMEGHEEGLAEGHAEGHAVGKEETTRATALNLLQQGVDIEIIKAVTGLGVAAIEDLMKSVR